MEDTKRRAAKKAVALRYHRDLPAPFILAKGPGRLADEIIRLAEEHEIPIQERSELADALFSLDVGVYIPEDLYQTVAELLVFVQYISKRNRNGDH